MPETRGGPDTAGVRGALAEALAGWWVGEPGHEITEDEAVELSEYLLPVVRRLAVEKAAEIVTRVAEIHVPMHGYCVACDPEVRDWLRECGATIAAAQPDGETG